MATDKKLMHLRITNPPDGTKVSGRRVEVSGVCAQIDWPLWRVYILVHEHGGKFWPQGRLETKLICSNPARHDGSNWRGLVDLGTVPGTHLIHVVRVLGGDPAQALGDYGRSIQTGNWVPWTALPPGCRILARLEIELSPNQVPVFISQSRDS